VAAGLNAALTKQTVDVTIGDACQALNIAMINVENAARFLAPVQPADLEALGYTPEDVAVITSALGDLDRLRRVYEGLEEATPAYDFRTFSQRLYGTGFVPGR
jgi:hypothetical protein